MEDRNESAILRKIDLGEAYRKIMRNKKLFSITLVSTLLLSSIIIFSVPRYYICLVKRLIQILEILAPLHQVLV